MGTLVQPLNDILSVLSTLDVTNGDGNAVKLYTRIWNNQIRYESDGKLYNFPKPASFVEVVSPATFEILGEGYRSCDVNFRVHITHEDYNNEGTFEQDLRIFTLRDNIIKLLTFYRPTGCGPLNAMAENQDFEHSNIYHYIIDFVCNFTDDTAKRVYIEKPPSTNLELDIQTANEIVPNNYNVTQGKTFMATYTASTDGEGIFFIVDSSGQQIISAEPVLVIKEIQPLKTGSYNWDLGTSTMSGFTLDKDQTIFILFQQNI